MNILFLTLVKIRSLDQRDIYTDLMNEFVGHGHDVFIASPVEKKEKIKDFYVSSENIRLLGVNIGNYFSVSKIRKGLTTLTLERNYLKSIKRTWKGSKFDLILYSTPPISFCNVIKYFKKRDNAFAYLMLKDIFPQNAVDLGLISTKGPMSILYKYFRYKEKQLYDISDVIGCMSRANCKYVIKNNPSLSPSKVELCPNAITLREHPKCDKNEIRKKYNLPINEKIFVYGGNIGPAQGIDFIIQCLSENENHTGGFILIIGSGSEYKKLSSWFLSAKPKHALLIPFMAKNEFDIVVSSCDIGLIFLDDRFTIPNFPSRLLTYLEYGLPILASTDVNSDIGKIITDGGFGVWCESNNSKKFIASMAAFSQIDCSKTKNVERKYLETNCTSFVVCGFIMKHLTGFLAKRIKQIK